MIIHMDLDCYFVSAMRIYNPSLNGKKIAVVGSDENNIFGHKVDPDSNKGVVLSASYEARKFGVKSAMSVTKAKNLCPDLELVKSDMQLYRKLSNEIYDFLYTFTPIIEKFSIDEFFMDLQGTKFQYNGLKFAKFLQYEIFNKFKLPCSIGVSEEKFIAKLATNLAKPNGVKEILVKDLHEKLKDVNISEFTGIGKSMQKFLNKHCIYTIGEALNAKFLFDKMGKNGDKIYKRLSGTLGEKLTTCKERKSLGISRVIFPTSDKKELRRKIQIMCRHLGFEILDLNLNPTTYEIKIRYHLGEEFSKRVTINSDFSMKILGNISLKLFDELHKFEFNKISKIAISVSNFVFSRQIEKTLFSKDRSCEKKLDKTIKEIWDKFGIDMIKMADEI